MTIGLMPASILAPQTVTIRDLLCALGLDACIRRAYIRDCQADSGLTRAAGNRLRTTTWRKPA